MPHAVEVVSGLVARLRVLRIQVQRFALVRPLLGAVVAGDDLEIRAHHLVGTGRERRPQRGTGTIAGALAVTGHILVEGVERHALEVGHEAVDLVDLDRRRPQVVGSERHATAGKRNHAQYRSHMSHFQRPFNRENRSNPGPSRQPSGWKRSPSDAGWLSRIVFGLRQISTSTTTVATYGSIDRNSDGMENPKPCA